MTDKSKRTFLKKIGLVISTGILSFPFINALQGIKFNDLTYQSTVRTTGVSSILAPYKNLYIENNITNPNYQIDVTADKLVLENVSGIQTEIQSISFTLDLTTSGLNGLDTGSEAISTWNHIWAIRDSSNNIGGLLSTSSDINSITFPSGYSYAGYLGAIQNNSSGNFISLVQKNNWAVRDSIAAMVELSQTSYTLLDLSNCIPSTATYVAGGHYGKDNNAEYYIISVSPTLAGIGSYGFRSRVHVWNQGE